MKRKFLPITLLLAGIMMLASCLSDDDNSSNINLYGDAAITSFSLGTLNKTYLYNNGDTIKKKTDGKDSTTTVDCSSYKMIIDQLEKKVYNADSLPAGVDLEKVVCTVNTLNSGIVTIQRLTSDTLDYYSGDSIDLRKPRKFFIYSSDGKYRRQYDVEIRAHKEQPDSFAWHKRIDPILKQSGMKEGKVMVWGDQLVMAASNGSSSHLFTCDADGDTWSQKESNMNMVFDAATFNNVAVEGNRIYLLNNSQLLCSEDGRNWTTLSYQGTTALKSLLGAGSSKIYATATDGVYGSSDGKTWEKCSVDGDLSRLPNKNWSINTLPSKTNIDVERLVLVGQNTAANDTAAIVWGKLNDKSEANDTYAWSLYEGINKQLLPCMANTSVMKYDGKLFAIGGEGLNGSSAKAYTTLYCSSDQGLTWQKSKLFTLPADLPSADKGYTLLMCSDRKNNVRILCLNTGEVWKMRINRLGWKGAY